MVNDRQSLDFTRPSWSPCGSPVACLISDAPLPYIKPIAAMEARVADIAALKAPELVWLLEHPPLYTSGTSGKAHDLLDARFPLFATGRGGQLTYHGPGQRVAYVMLDLKRRRPDVRAFVAALGVRRRRWVSFHGISINVTPDLTHFDAIVPCGVVDPRYGVTSLADLGYPATMADVDIALRRAFEAVFGAVHTRLP